MGRSATPREIGELGPPRKDAVRAQVDIVPSVLVLQDLAIAGHQNGDRVGQQQHSRGDSARQAIEPLVTNAGILQFDRIHQVMKSNVRIAAAQAREQGRHQSGESYNWIAAECAKEQIEPDHIRLEPMQGLQKAEHAARIVKRPAALNAESRLLDMIGWEFVGQNGKTKERITLQLLSDVKTIFAQSARTGGKSRDQTYFH